MEAPVVIGLDVGGTKILFHLEVLASGHAGDRAARELFGPEADAHALIQRATAGDDAAQSAFDGAR